MRCSRSLLLPLVLSVFNWIHPIYCNNPGSVGAPTKNSNVPYYHVGIHLPYTPEPFCVGALISDKHVLTSASCFFDNSGRRKINNAFVSLGLSNLRDGHLAIKVDVHNVTEHPDHHLNWKLHEVLNVAIIELKSSVTFTENVKPICISRNNIPENTRLVVTGWGIFDSGQQGKLQRAAVVTVPDGQCKGIFAAYTSNMLCTSITKTNLCDFKTGEPLVWRDGEENVLTGIISRGPKCNPSSLEDPGSPIIFSTKVAPLRDWIETVTNIDLDSVACRQGSVSPTPPPTSKTSTSKILPASTTTTTPRATTTESLASTIQPIYTSTSSPATPSPSKPVQVSGYMTNITVVHRFAEAKVKFNLHNPNDHEYYHDAEFDIPSKALVSKLSAICQVELFIGGKQFDMKKYVQILNKSLNDDDEKFHVRILVRQKSSCEVHLHYSYIVEMKNSMFEVKNRVNLTNFISKPEYVITVTEGNPFVKANRIPSSLEAIKQGNSSGYSIKVEQTNKNDAQNQPLGLFDEFGLQYQLYSYETCHEDRLNFREYVFFPLKAQCLTKIKTTCEVLGLASGGFTDFDNEREVDDGGELLIIGKRDPGINGKYLDFPNFQVRCSLENLEWDKNACARSKSNDPPCVLPISPRKNQELLEILKRNETDFLGSKAKHPEMWEFLRVRNTLSKNKEFPGWKSILRKILNNSDLTSFGDYIFGIDSS